MGVRTRGIRQWRRRLELATENPGCVRIATAVAVLVAMVWAHATGDVINRDGIIYVRAAQALLDQGLAASMAIYNWPGYSLLIAAVIRLGGTTPEMAAAVINGVCWMVLADAFVRLAHRLDGAAGRPWVPALVILSLPVFGHRLEIYRDWGYLGFGLLACVPLLRIWQSGCARWRDVIAWFAAMLVALSFRIEAAALIVLTPPVLLLRPGPWLERLRAAGMLAAIVLGPALLLGLALAMRDPVLLGKFADLLTYADLSNYLARWDALTAKFADSVLNKYSNDAAGFMLAAGVIAMIVRMVLANLGPLLMLLLAIALWRQQWRLDAAYRLVGGLLLVAMLVLVAFMFLRVITVNRYALYASLLLMLFLSHGITRLFDPEALDARGGRWRASIALAGLIVAALVNVSARPDAKEYLRDAGSWLHGNVEGSTTIVANDERLLYYARREPGPKLDTFDKVRDALQAARPPYYAALRFNDSASSSIHALFRSPPVVVFRSRRASERAEIFYVSDAP